VFAALGADCVQEPADAGNGLVWRYRQAVPEGSEATTCAGPAVVPAEVFSPAWLDRDAPADEPIAAALAPSSAQHQAATPGVRSPGARAARNKARARGDIVHRLLQSLPDIPAAARSEAARRHVARNGKALSDEERAALVDDVLRVLDDARFRELFSPGSRAEVPIVGRLVADGRTIDVSGVIDRLAVGAQAVLLADYKTTRSSPGAHDAYVAQLALYRAVLRELYPDKAIRAILVWTEGPDLSELSSAQLDAALAALTSP
jgi:ATP-dependent helicase/nuclease subunit A